MHVHYMDPPASLSPHSVPHLKLYQSLLHRWNSFRHPSSSYLISDPPSWDIIPPIKPAYMWCRKAHAHAHVHVHVVTSSPQQTHHSHQTKLPQTKWISSQFWLQWWCSEKCRNTNTLPHSLPPSLPPFLPHLLPPPFSLTFSLTHSLPHLHTPSLTHSPDRRGIFWYRRCSHHDYHHL